MNRIDKTFRRLRFEGKKGIIPYLTAGVPDLDTTGEIILELGRCGADMVELGVPFSDPVADGPVIQAASQRALKNGVTLDDVLALARKVRPKTALPLLLMTYYNPVFAYGLAKFVEAAGKSGIDGVIVPDLPLEESGELDRLMEPAGIHLIYFLSPTSPDRRLQEIVKKARGFIYCVSAAGVTGTRDSIPPEGLQLLERARKATSLPLALGFGISHPGQVKALQENGDAVIIGSAIVKLLLEGGRPGELIFRIDEFFGCKRR